jgi:hypothetical protein
MGESNDPRQRVERLRFSELMMNCIIWKDNFVAFTAVGFNYEVQSGGLHEGQAGSRNLATVSSLVRRQENQAVSRLSAAGPSKYAMRSSQQSGKQDTEVPQRNNLQKGRKV